MKTKNKLLAVAKIAIVLCSVFLVALPAIAAEQNTQVSASTITTASEDGYVLGVYGNANEDDTIDMRDLTHVKLIFFGKKPETELADAKYDGKLNPLDFIQIKLIIVGKEKELTLVDAVDRIVTVKKPVEHVVVLWPYPAEVMRAFRVQDKIDGVSSSIAKREIYFPELSKLPSITSSPDMDYEAILSLNPDLVIISPYNTAKHAEKLQCIPVVGSCFFKPEILAEGLKKFGYIFDREEEAEEFIDFYVGYMKTIKERTEGSSEEDRPRVYFESISNLGDKWRSTGSKSGWHQKIEIAGGNNIFGHISQSYITVDPEEVIMRDPEVILVRIWSEVGGGYATDDITGLSKVRDEIMNRPELANVAAVKTGSVYVVHVDIFGGLNYLPGTAYCAKWFHPELFEDLDPHAIHQEYLTDFQGLDYDLDEHGLFVHPEEYPDGK